MNYFNPKAYLKEYYSHVSPENKAILEFFAEVAKRNVSGEPKHLELGCGPTIYQAIALAPKVSEIVYTDGFQESIDEIKHWLEDHEDSFDWKKFIHATMEAENGKSPTEQEVKDREEHIKGKIKKQGILDISSTESISRYIKEHGPFGSISSVFALEVPAKDHDHLKSLLQTIYKDLPKGGVFNAVMVAGGQEYKVGESYLRNLRLETDDLKKMLTSIGFKVNEAIWRYVPADKEDEGYKGIMMISVLK